MGNHIAEKVLSSWSASLKKTKGSPNSASSQQLPSVRLLLPLLLLAEYVASVGEETTTATATDHDDPDSQQHEKARNQFWKTVVLVWNLVQQFMDVPPVTVPTNDNKKKTVQIRMPLDDKNEMQEDGDDDDLLLLQTQLMPKDYKSLAGFQPFSKFIPMNDKDKSSTSSTNNNACSAGFVSDEEAMRFFESSSMTGQSQQQQQHDNGKSNTTLTRRIMTVANRIANSNSDCPKWMCHIIKNQESGMLEWQESIVVVVVADEKQQEQQLQQQQLASPEKPRALFLFRPGF
jgi:hypothetical protein